MQLSSTDGPTMVELSIEGYQFPNADDPRLRYSWHMITGRARDFHEEWAFRFPALTCDESPRLSEWIRRAADWTAGEACVSGPAALTFTEPNLTFSVIADSGGSVIRVELDLEFRSPTHRTRREAFSARNVLDIVCTSADLKRAAQEWDADVALFPDGPI